MGILAEGCRQNMGKAHQEFSSKLIYARYLNFSFKVRADHTRRAFLLASATAALLEPRRSDIDWIHFDSGSSSSFARHTVDLPPCISNVRKYRKSMS